MFVTRKLSAAEGDEHLSSLADILLDCVQGGASVSFMASVTAAEARSFFKSVLSGVEQGTHILLGAFNESRLAGTVQIVTAMPPNQPQRAEIAKLLVHRSARGQGVGRRLMQCAEETAKLAGKRLLTLDTVTGGVGEKLYRRLGWTEVGVIPNYALFPDGRWCDTTIFYKQLS